MYWNDKKCLCCSLAATINIAYVGKRHGIPLTDCQTEYYEKKFHSDTVCFS